MFMKKEKIYTLIVTGIVFLWAALPVAGQTGGICRKIPLPVPMIDRRGGAKPCIVTDMNVYLLSDTNLTGDDYENTGCISCVFDDNTLFPSPLSLVSTHSENNNNLSSATQLPRPPPSL